MYCQSNQDNNEMVEFNYQSFRKEMAQGGLISASICTNQAVFEANEVPNNTVLWYTVLVQWEDFSHVDTSSSSTEISGRFWTVMWKLRLQYSCKHRAILWLNTFVCRYRAFHPVPGEILAFYPAIFIPKLVMNHWDWVLYTFDRSVSALLKE